MWSSPKSLVPQPDLWVMASTPSMFAYSRDTSRNLSFTNWLTLAEQFTPEMMAT